MVTCSYNINNTLIWLLHNRRAAKLVKKVMNINEYLETREYKPNYQMLDNKASIEIREFYTVNKCIFN